MLIRFCVIACLVRIVDVVVVLILVVVWIDWCLFNFCLLIDYGLVF